MVSAESGRLDYIETLDRWLAAFKRVDLAKYLAYGSVVLRHLFDGTLRRYADFLSINPNRVCFERQLLDFGVATAVMNQSFFQAIDRIHLGSAVAIEFLGPFLLAALGRRTWRHFGFVLVAAAGVVALTRPGSGITWQGALFAAVAGAGWAAYTYSSHRVGGVTEGFEGLAGWR